MNQLKTLVMSWFWNLLWNTSVVEFMGIIFPTPQKKKKKKKTVELLIIDKVWGCWLEFFWGLCNHSFGKRLIFINSVLLL